jgi:imidazolonepropionase-like amidohydrolase
MRTLIRAGQLITAQAGDLPRHNQGILIEKGVIQAVGDWEQFAPDVGDTLIDASAHTVMPGLIDAHTHVVHSGEPHEDWRLIALTELTPTTAFKAARHARRQVERGVTTIRDVGASDWIDIALRDAINAGWQFGPRMLVAGHGITSTGGHMDASKFARPGIVNEQLNSIGVVADGPDEARRAAWAQIMRGADLIKINATLSEYVRASGGQCSPEMTLDTMAAICEVAHNNGRKVAAHCHGGAGVQAALAAGVDTFEHGRFLTDALLDEIAEKERYLVPTLSPEARRVELGETPEDPALVRWLDMATEAMYDTVARAWARGVQIVAGTDAGMPHVRHGDLPFEMVHLAKAGLTNLAVIESATRVAAKALGIDDLVGQVAAGCMADLLFVDGDPVAALAILEDPTRIKAVIQAGQVSVDRRFLG